MKIAMRNVVHLSDMLGKEGRRPAASIARYQIFPEEVLLLFK
jgi:hypothetical protein